MGDLPIKKNVARTLYIPGLFSQADTKLFQANPTIAAGDFKYSLDGGAWTNLATLPDVYPAAGTQVRLQIAQAELNGDQLNIRWSDAAGAEWCDGGIVILTSTLQTGDTFAANLIQILGTGLTESVAGYLAVGLKKLLDVASPVFTLASKNQSADNDTKLTSIQADYARRTGDYSTITADQVWAALTASLITPGSIGAWILDKLDVKVSSVSVGTVPTVAQIWQYAWRTLTTGSAKSGLVEESNTISANTFATFNYQISDLGSLANYSTLYFTIKTTKKDSDNDAILQVSKKLSGVGDGLLKILGGTVTPTASDGSITIDNATTGIITVNIAVGVMSLLKSGKYFADVKIIRSSGIPVEILRDYSFNLLDVVTKAIA